jgi:hypothetical protein
MPAAWSGERDEMKAASVWMLRHHPAPVMPAKVGIHALSSVHAAQSWMPTFVGMT